MPPPLTAEQSERVRAVVTYLVEVNGGTPDNAIDALAAEIENFSIDNMTASMPEAVKEHIDDLAEDELKELIAQVQRTTPRDSPPAPPSCQSVPAAFQPQLGSEDVDMTPAPFVPYQREPAPSPEPDPNSVPRCWTTGQSMCGCHYYPRNRGPGQPYDDGYNVVCEMNCPPGESQAEQERVRERCSPCYSPCCGMPGCVCTEGIDWEGTRDHPYDPECLRNDCECKNFPMDVDEDE